jgi:sulfur-oxidizing protein SoxX
MTDIRTLLALSLACIGIASCATAPPSLTLEEKHQRMRANWTPGGLSFVEAQSLTMFPCHDEELPCGKMAPPALDRVTFKGPLRGDAKKGEAIAINIRYGNCIACHNLPNGHMGGTIGPSLADYGKRGVPAEVTYQRIWDVRAFNPNAFMPLYGPNAVLTEQEIHDVMAFLQLGK